jgi:ABC-type dipeptide/oligopeptide/nickel transport system ATPase component
VKRRAEDLPSPACPVDLFFSPLQRGCPFYSRCPNCTAQCQEQAAPLHEVESDHHVACFLHYG